MNKLTLLAASVAASAAVVTPAQAEPPKSVEVGYSDLNLRTSEGIAQLDRRIDRAIDTVCDYRSFVSDRLFNRTARLCVSETLADVTPARDRVIQAHQRGQVEVIAKLVIERPLQQ